MTDERIQLYQSTISQRWVYYIDGERRGSAPTRDQAQHFAEEALARKVAAQQ